jgi:protein-L-isoaspartate(D-aspartate) O-methyltransferase
MSVIKLAGCVLTDDTGKVLLVHRQTADYDHWEVPGGKIEEGETAQAAAVRELQEELGIEVSIEHDMGTARFIDNSREFEYAWFQATTKDTSRIVEPHLFTEWRYFDPEQLLRGKLSLSKGAETLLGLVQTGDITL